MKNTWSELPYQALATDTTEDQPVILKIYLQKYL